MGKLKEAATASAEKGRTEKVVDELKALVLTKEEDVQQSQEEVRRAQTELAGRTEELAAARGQMKKDRQELNLGKGKIEYLEGEVRALQAAKDGAEEAQANLRGHLEAAQHQISAYKLKVAALLKAPRHVVVEATERRGGSISPARGAAADGGVNEELVAELQSSLAARDAAINSLESDKADMEVSTAGLRSELVDLKAQLKAEKTKAEALTGAVEMLSRVQEAAAAGGGGEKGATSQVAPSSGPGKRVPAGKRGSSRGGRAPDSKAGAGASAEVALLRVELAAKEGAVGELRSKVEILGGELAPARAELAACKVRLGAVEASLAEKEHTCQFLEHEVNVLSAENAQLTALQEELREKNPKHAQALLEKRDLEGQVERMKAELAQRGEDLEALQEAADKSAAAASRAAAKVAEPATGPSSRFSDLDLSRVTAARAKFFARAWALRRKGSLRAAFQAWRHATRAAGVTLAFMRALCVLHTRSRASRRDMGLGLAFPRHTAVVLHIWRWVAQKERREADIKRPGGTRRVPARRAPSPTRARRGPEAAPKKIPTEEALTGMMKEVVSEEVQKLREHLDLELALHKGSSSGLLANVAAFVEGEVTPVRQDLPGSNPASARRSDAIAGGGNAKGTGGASRASARAAAAPPGPAPSQALADGAQQKRLGQRKLTWSAAVADREGDAGEGAAGPGAAAVAGDPGQMPDGLPPLPAERGSEQLVGICDTVMSSLARVQEMIGSAAHQPEVAKSPNPESNARLEKLVRTLKRAKKKAGGEKRSGTERSEEELKYRHPGRQSSGLDYGKSRRSPVQNRRVTIRATWGGSQAVDGE